MEKKEPVFVFSSTEVQELLADNHIDLVDILKREGVDVERGFEADPARGAGTGYKDVPTVILATAALIVALTPIVSRIVGTLAHRTALVREMVLIPVTDAEGNIVRDASGEPKLYWAPRAQFVESSETMDEMPNISIKGFGIEISLKP